MSTVDEPLPLPEPGARDDGGAQPPGWLGDEQGRDRPPHRRRSRAAFTAAVLAALIGGTAAGWAVGGAHTTTVFMSASGQAGATATAPVENSVVDVVATVDYGQAVAAGTGIVLTPTGEVLTNNHVIDGATSISVTDVGNGRTYGATVVGYDVSDDIAVLQLSGASGLATANLASTVTVGEPVTAIGNAGGTGGTPSVSTGTVTAVGASITAGDEFTGTAEHLSGLIQTSATLEAGDSGGPLVNAAGQVVGIDTAGSTGFQLQSGGSQGYAIPITTAVSIARQVESASASTTVHIGPTAFLGVAVGQSAAQGGAAIVGVEPGTPAAGAGLQAGDVVTSVNGTAVASSSALSSALQLLRPGQRVTVGWTDQAGQAHTATVTLTAGPAA
jgi:S1-C subfamily serine protease